MDTVAALDRKLARNDAAITQIENGIRRLDGKLEYRKRRRRELGRKKMELQTFNLIEL